MPSVKLMVSKDALASIRRRVVAVRPASPPVTRVIRRVRPAAPVPERTTALPAGKTVQPTDRRKMDELMKSISDADTAIATAKEIRDSACADLKALMKTYRLATFTTPVAPDYVAEVGRKKGKATNVIDPAGFRELVSDEEFMAAIRVSSERAKELLSGKELKGITDSVPAKLGEEVIEVSRKK